MFGEHMVIKIVIDFQRYHCLSAFRRSISCSFWMSDVFCCAVKGDEISSPVSIILAGIPTTTNDTIRSSSFISKQQLRTTPGTASLRPIPFRRFALETHHPDCASSLQSELQALLKRIDARRKEHIKQRNLDSKRLLQRNRNVQTVLESKQNVEGLKLTEEIKKVRVNMILSMSYVAISSSPRLRSRGTHNVAVGVSISVLSAEELEKQFVCKLGGGGGRGRGRGGGGER